MLSHPESRTRPPKVYVTRRDYEQLSERADAFGHTLAGQSLRTELERAIIAPDHTTRPFVKLGSTVTYEDLASGAVRQLKLCLPEDASLDDMRISVLTPVGAALIGGSVGQVFDYVAGDGRDRRLRVLEVSDDG